MTLDAEPPWLTVVTVVKDDPVGFVRTRQSLAQQDVKGIEHLIVDSSRDRGQIPSHMRDCVIAGVADQYLWQRPRGVYPAMNTALECAAGQYIYFANAGDYFYSAQVLRAVHDRIRRGEDAWLYGDIEIVDTHGGATVTPPWDYDQEREQTFSRGRFPSHQATFLQTRILRDIGGFDLTYSIVADYAVFLTLSTLYRPTYLNLVVATFHEGGLSTQNWRTAIIEFHRARRRILRPQGWDSVRELRNTGLNMAATWLHRGMIRRPRNNRS